MPHVETRLRVRYKETDQMGIAHHSNYLVWFEVGRSDLCRRAGISYREIEDLGYLLVVTEVSCRYGAPFRYEDEVVLATEVGEISSRSITFRYELNAAEESVRRASGETRHLWIDRATGKPVRAPREISDLFLPFLRT